MTGRGLLLFVLVFALCFQFRQCEAFLDRHHLLLEDQPGILRLILCLLSLATGSRMLKVAFLPHVKDDKATTHIVVGVVLLGLALIFARTLF